MKNIITLTILFVFILSLTAYAARPLATEDTGTVSIGEWEIETGFESEIDEDQNFTNSLGLSIKTGILDNLDMGIETSSQYNKYQGEAGETALKIKYNIMEGNNLMPSFSIAGSISNPPGGGDHTTSFNLVFSKYLDYIACHINFGSSSTPKENETNYNGAIEYPLNEISDLVAEIVGISTSDSLQLDGLVGGRIQLSDNITIDGGLNIAMSDDSPASKYTIGLTVIL